MKKVRKAFNPDEVGKEAGIDFLNRGGFLFTRFEIIDGMDDKTFVTQDTSYAKAVLPWLNTKKSKDHFERNDAFLDAIDFYTDLVQHMRKQTLQKLSTLNEQVLAQNLERRLEDPEATNIPFFTEEELTGFVVEPELEELRGKLEQKLLWMGKTLLGISFDSPDDNKTFILEKQVIFEQNPQTRAIFEMIRDAVGKDQVGTKKDSDGN